MCDSHSGEALIEHKQNAEKAFESQRQDKMLTEADSNVCVITFDLQKTLPLPKTSTSVAFYLRQLWIYNLGVHLTAKNRSEAHFPIWTEADGGRGCCEVASSLLTVFDSAGVADGSNLVAWSDSCSGQIKTFILFVMAISHKVESFFYD